MPGRSDPDDLLSRGVRLTAAAAVALVVAAVVTIGDGHEPAVLAPSAVALAGLGTWRWRRAGRTPAATSAVVGATALAVLAARAVVDPGLDDLDAFLTVAGAAVLALGYLTDERRLVALGLVQWTIALGRWHVGDPVFEHCLIATDVTIPLPRLNGPLLLGAGSVLVGTLQRWLGWRPEAGRGAEVTGLILTMGAILLKAPEVTHLEVLCGTGATPIDPGWVVVGLALGLAAVAYGLLGEDAVWAAGGVLTVTAHGLMATLLTGNPLWAAAALVPIAGGVMAMERAGRPWPHRPGYGHPPRGD